jgi:Flp pilus assembly protein TadB
MTTTAALFGLLGAVGAVTGWVVAAILTVLAVVGLPRILGSNVDHKRHLERIEAIAGWTEMLRDTLVAAAGLEQAILATAPACPEAIREEITELAVRLERGERLAPSLRHLADQLRDPTADLVISALVLAAEHQARQLADLLGELASEAREQASMRMRVEAGRARTKTSVRVIVITTLSFALGLVLLNRGYLAPYDSAFGQIMLLLVGALFAAAFAWLARIARLREPERFLTELGTIRPHDADVDVDDLLTGKGASS